MFVMNAWYAAGLTSEVGEGLLARRICDKPIVLYRRRDGVAVAFEDLCLHRMLPLSQGRREGDAVVCGYHGVTYDSAGRCIHIPGQPRIPASYRLHSYPLVERHRFVWLWMGDPALADPAEVPDLHWNDDPRWDGIVGTMFIKCDYRMLIDNLLDLSHETFVHESTIGNTTVAETPIESAQDGRRVSVSRWMLDHEPAPLWRQRIGGTAPCDRWQLVDYVYPSNVVIDVGVAHSGTGAPEGDRSQGVNHMIINAITPCTRDTTHYFWGAIRNYGLGDETRNEATRAAARRIFGEDKAVLEAQYQAMLDNPGHRMINLAIDGPSLRVRRIIDQQIEAERTALPEQGVARAAR